MYENYVKEASIPSITDTYRGYIDELLKGTDKLIMEYEQGFSNDCQQNNSCEYESCESKTEKEFMELKKLGKCVDDFGGKSQGISGK